jgi:epoxyqueuosine reductase
VVFNYYPKNFQINGSYKIAKYTYSEDYHHVMKNRLKKLLFSIQNEIREVAGRAFVDSAPILEKTWAAKSRLGWVGKNSDLLT